MIAPCKHVIFCVTMLYVLFAHPVSIQEILAYITANKFKNSALIIIDMWDNHWCKTMAREGNFLAVRTNEFAKVFRAQGGLVIHAAYFGETQSVQNNELKKFLKFRGCKCPGHICKVFTDKRVWRNINPAIIRCKDDFVMTELRQLLKMSKLRYFFIIGQHVNECLLKRPISALALLNCNKKFCIIRDLTNDSFCYNCPAEIKAEFFDWVEKKVCPLVNSGILFEALGTQLPNK